MLNPKSVPFNMNAMPGLRHIARSYMEDISMITRTSKPSTPQLEHEFTSALRDLERRQAVRMMAFSQSFQDLCNARSTVTEETPMMAADQWSIDPQMDQNIQAFLDRFYTINLGTQLLIGEHLALHDRGQNLVQRVNPVSISKCAIKDAQRACAAHYGQPAPSVLLQTPNPSISMTYVEEFLHRTIYELLKNGMRTTYETHHAKDGAPVSLCMMTSKGRDEATVKAATGFAALPPITLTLVEGGEDVTIKIMDEGGGLALSEEDKIWSYVDATANPSGTVATKNPVALFNGLGNGVKEYLNLSPDRSGHGLPLVRLMARYFGGDLSLVSMEGHGTHSYLSLYKDDDHLENVPEVENTMEDDAVLAEIDEFVDDLLSNDTMPWERKSVSSTTTTTTTTETNLPLPLEPVAAPFMTYSMAQ